MKANVVNLRMLTSWPGWQAQAVCSLQLPGGSDSVCSKSELASTEISRVTHSPTP